MTPPPNMQTEYERELKKLTAEISRCDAKAERIVHNITRHITKVQRSADKQIKSTRKCADRDIRRIQAELKKEIKPFLREITTTRRAAEKATAARQRRIDILHGRLGS